MIFEEDDFPTGFGGEGNWPKVIESLKTFDSGARQGLWGVVRKGATWHKQDRYKTEAWKEKHRQHARESARRRRAAKKATLLGTSPDKLGRSAFAGRA